MKSFKIIPLTILLVAVTSLSFAQSKEESFKVSGNCGMCKSKIEKAAKSAGASYALWDAETKIITVKYNSSTTNTARIQQKIADVGYDNEGFKASDAVYEKLHGCCKYDRQNIAAKESCCSQGSCDMEECKKAGCCKDGKCDMSLCPAKEAKDGKSCCKKEGTGSCCSKNDHH